MGQSLSFGFSGEGSTGTHKFGEFTYSATTTTPPPVGDIIFDNADPKHATKMYVSDLTAGGKNVRGDLLSMRVGSNFTLEDEANAANNINFHVTAITGQTGYVEYEVNHVHTAGTITAGHIFDLENIAAGGDTTYLELTDTDNSYATKATMVPAVNAAEKATAFVKVPKTSSEDETTGDLKFAVVAAMPGTPDSDTVYFVK